MGVECAQLAFDVAKRLFWLGMAIPSHVRGLDRPALQKPRSITRSSYRAQFTYEKRMLEAELFCTTAAESGTHTFAVRTLFVTRLSCLQAAAVDGREP